MLLQYSLRVSQYLTLSLFPPNSAAAAFLKKLLAGLEMWKSGAEWQQLAGRRSGLKPCEEPKWVIWWEVGGGSVIVKLLRCDIYSVQHRVTQSWQSCLTCVKKSCLRMWSRLGLSSGILASRLAISCLACGDRDEGREQRASLIHLYVSFRLVVSKGGLPSSIVYLEEDRGH